MKQKQQNTKHPQCRFPASCFMLHEKGFTILELILVIGIFAVIAGVATVQLANFQRGTVLESTSKDVVSALRLAHDKAMLGEDGNSNGQGDPWGIRFANSTADTYASFYGAAYDINNVKETTYL
ncbi:MAG: type II secretion system protein, partial [Patescibacteria group bacterium]